MVEKNLRYSHTFAILNWQVSYNSPPSSANFFKAKSETFSFWWSTLACNHFWSFGQKYLYFLKEKNVVFVFTKYDKIMRYLESMFQFKD